MVRKTIFIDFERIFCPICSPHIIPRNLIKCSLEVGEMTTTVDVMGPDRRRVVLKNFWGGEVIAPFSLILKRKEFMQRPRYKCIGLTIGSYDEIGNYYFRRKVCEITW